MTKATAAILACFTLLPGGPAAIAAEKRQTFHGDARGERQRVSDDHAAGEQTRRQLRAAARTARRGRTHARLQAARRGGLRAVRLAHQFLGVPYSYGGASRAGFDCSGFTMTVYGLLGVRLDHYTGSQWHAGPRVPRRALRPGDLVFFDGSSVPGHVGIYVGGDRFIHAPHSGTVVSVESLSTEPGYVGAVRPPLG